MPERSFRRASHRQVAATLLRFDRRFLESTRCYFGGGTRIVLELGEYRESRDVDFLCADRDGYRRLRETVSETSLGSIARAASRSRATSEATSTASARGWAMARSSSSSRSCAKRGSTSRA